MSDVLASLFKELERAIKKDKGDESTKRKENKISKSFKLLYTIDGSKFDAREFHSKCDGQGPTLTLLYGEYNTLFGGYTSQDWSCDKRRIKRDGDAFLFCKKKTLGPDCKIFRIKQNEYLDSAIVCDKQFGPTFGVTGTLLKTYDLQTFTHSIPKSAKVINKNFSLNGEINMPNVYLLESSSKIETEDINNGSMSVSAVEVYQVIDDSLEEPWIKKPSDKEIEKMKNQLENIEKITEIDLHQYNILLVGTIGAGKSSFCNTLASAFANEVKEITFAAAEQCSVTQKVIQCTLHNKKGEELKIKIFDIRGYEEERGYDIEFELLLEGKLPNEYSFPDKPPQLADINIKQKSTINDKIHLVCLVVDSTKIKLHSDKLIQQTEDIRKHVYKQDIPLVAIATKLDQLCPRIDEDADYVYLSPRARDETLAVSKACCVDKKYVFPIINYTDDEICPGKTRLAIQALDKMVKLAKNTICKAEKRQKEDCRWSDRVKLLRVMRSKEDKEIEIVELCNEMSKFDDKTLRVLFYGPVNSGKSNFIDSVMSSLIGRIAFKATGGYVAEETRTASKTEKMYQLKYQSKSGSLQGSNVYFCDMPGIQDVGGVNKEHTKLVVKGHVPNKFKIQNGISKDSKFYVKERKQRNTIHCVCFVFDVSSVQTISEAFKSTCSVFQKWLSDKDIPHIVVLTKGDKTISAVTDETLQMFENKVIKEDTDKLIEMFKFRESRVFLVRNYIHEYRLVPEMDVLLLDALREILRVGYEYLEDNCDDNTIEDINTDNDCSGSDEKTIPEN